MKKYIIILLAVFLVALPGIASAAGSIPQTRDGSIASPPSPVDGVATPVDPMPYPEEVAPVYPVIPAYPGDGGSIDVPPPTPIGVDEVVPPYPGVGGNVYPGSEGNGGRDIAVPPAPPIIAPEPGQADSGAPISERTLPPDIEYENPEQPVSGDTTIENSANVPGASRGDAVRTQEESAKGQEYAGEASLVSVLNRKPVVVYYAIGSAVIILTALVVVVILKKKKA